MVKLEPLGLELRRVDDSGNENYQAGDYVITDVEANSPAREKGVTPGWVLERINEYDVRAANLNAIKKEIAEKDVVRLQLRGERGTRLVGVRLRN